MHLLAHLAAFGLAAYAVAQIVDGGQASDFVLWFIGAAVVHDLLFFPLYSVLDRVLGRVLPRRRPRSPGINYLRVPALLSGLLLLIYLPLILGLAGHNYFRASGHHLDGYVGNWLLITAGLFAGSALVYVIRRARGRLSRSRSPR